MEADMVQSVALADREDTAPLGDIRGGITRARECGTVERSTQEDGFIVDGELTSVGGEFPHAESCRQTIGNAFTVETGGHFIEVRMMLVPRVEVRSHRISDLDGLLSRHDLNRFGDRIQTLERRRETGLGGKSQLPVDDMSGCVV